ncbi:MAG: hypothetical protein ACREOG_16340 [Gemmatimonadaceae bacterium]
MARALMALGLSVGVLAIGFWTFNIQVDVPAWMWRVAAIKLALAGAAGLIATGAVLLRYVRQSPAEHTAKSVRELAAPQWTSSARPRKSTSDLVTPSERPPTP